MILEKKILNINFNKSERFLLINQFDGKEYDMPAHEYLLDIYDIKTKTLYKQLCDLNPLNIMQRGYAVILDSEGRLKSSVDDFEKGDTITAVFKDGRLTASVTDKAKQ